MSDQRHQYVALRLEVALDGLKYSPSIAAFFDNSKLQDELLKFYATNGPTCITFVVDKLNEESRQHKLRFQPGAPKTGSDTRCPRTKTSRPSLSLLQSVLLLSCALFLCGYSSVCREMRAFTCGQSSNLQV
jgi:hypothetical protein